MPKRLARIAGSIVVALIVLAPTAAGAGSFPERAFAGSKNASPKKLVVAMTAAQEVPRCAQATDAARGKAVFRITDAAAGTVKYTITAKNVPGDINASHIHQAPAGTPGDIVQPLELKAGAKQGVIARGTIENPGLVSQLQESPADYYVNVHSSVCGPGAIRGQFGAGGGST